MPSDNEYDSGDINRRDIKIKVERFCEQAQVYLDRLPILKQQLDEINRLHQFDLYVQKLNEIGRIVQNLLQNILNVERLHQQLNDKDRVKLDRQIRLLRKEVDHEMSEFHLLRQQAMASSIQNSSTPMDNTTPITDNYADTLEHETISNELRQRHATTTDRLTDSYNALEQDLILLHETIGEVARLVEQHKEKISNTEHLINMAHDRIQDASTILHGAVRSKYVAVASGALLGATLGGPVGLIMGFKMGTLVALGGSAVGAFSANFLRRSVRPNDEVTKNNNSSYNQAML